MWFLKFKTISRVIWKLIYRLSQQFVCMECHLNRLSTNFLIRIFIMDAHTLSSSSKLIMSYH